MSNFASTFPFHMKQGIARDGLSLSKPRVRVHLMDLVRYEVALEHQMMLRNGLIAEKRARRTSGSQDQPLHHLIFCEHPHVYTLGKSGKPEHLLLDRDRLAEHSAEFIKVGRGGDITYHGPGQLVCYPILDLDFFFTDIHRYVRLLEESVIRLCAQYDLEAERIPGYTGVWLPPRRNDMLYRKICAIGVHLSRWVTMHGLALNVLTDLRYFDHLVPCGISDADKKVTSLEVETARQLSVSQVQKDLLVHMTQVFGFVVDQG